MTKRGTQLSTEEINSCLPGVGQKVTLTCDGERWGGFVTKEFYTDIDHKRVRCIIVNGIEYRTDTRSPLHPAKWNRGLRFQQQNTSDFGKKTISDSDELLWQNMLYYMDSDREQMATSGALEARNAKFSLSYYVKQRDV